MTLEQIITALADRTLTAVSKATGIHHNTLVRIRKGHVRTPHVTTLKVLSDYLTK